YNDGHFSNPAPISFSTRHTDSPVLDWYMIQPALVSSESDVLIVLDCCYAGQAARDRRMHRNKVLLLAAASMGQMVPGVGGQRKSFTQGLLSEMSLMLDQEAEVSIS